MAESRCLQNACSIGRNEVQAPTCLLYALLDLPTFFSQDPLESHNYRCNPSLWVELQPAATHLLTIALVYVAPITVYTAVVQYNTTRLFPRLRHSRSPAHTGCVLKCVFWLLITPGFYQQNFLSSFNTHISTIICNKQKKKISTVLTL